MNKLAAASLLILSVALVYGQTDPTKKRPVEGVELKVPPTIDGDLSDEAWKSASKAEGFIDRQTSALPPDPTIGYIAYDAKYIYVAFHCKDSRPDLITARETIRDHKYASQSDESPNKEDNVTFSIDPYFTQKASEVTVFSVNAIGTRSAKAAGGRGGKAEWKGDWDAAVKRVEDGYTVEIRIPWAILNYPTSRGPQTMSVNFHRFQDRTKIESVWSNIGARGFYEDSGRWTGVTVPQAAYKPTLSVLPYILPGFSDMNRASLRAGADARYTLTPELTAVASLNPDFNTIEGAVEGIQFSRRERFIPEKRPFFLEGQDYFQSSTRFNDIGALFYARRVRSFDVGTKLYGKLTPVDSVGFLNTTTFERQSDTVFRYKRDIDTSTSGGILVSNRTAVNDDNSLAVVDLHRRKGKWGLETQLGKTFGRRAGGGLAVLSGTFEDKNNVSLLQYQTISDNVRVANGFIPFTNQHGWNGFTDFFSQYRKSKWRSSDIGSWFIWNDHQDGTAYSHGAGIFGSLTHTKDWRVSTELNYEETDGTIDNTLMVGLRSRVTNRFRQFGINVTAGRLGSEPATFISPLASLRMLKKLDIAYSGALLNLMGHTNQHIVTTSFEFSPTQSIGGRMVVQNADTNWYLSYRNSGAKGTEVYFIIGDPNARKFVRQAQLKMIFSIG